MSSNRLDWFAILFSLIANAVFVLMAVGFYLKESSIFGIITIVLSGISQIIIFVCLLLKLKKK